MTILGFLTLSFFVLGLTGLFAQLFGVWNKYEKPSKAKVFFFYTFIVLFWGFLFYQGYVVETTSVVIPKP